MLIAEPFFFDDRQKAFRLRFTFLLVVCVLLPELLRVLGKERLVHFGTSSTCD